MANRLTKFIQHPQKANEAELKWSFFHFDCLFSFNLIALLLLLTFSYNLTSKIAKKKINVSSFWIKFNFFSYFSISIFISTWKYRFKRKENKWKALKRKNDVLKGGFIFGSFFLSIIVSIKTYIIFCYCYFTWIS